MTPRERIEALRVATCDQNWTVYQWRRDVVMVHADWLLAVARAAVGWRDSLGGAETDMAEDALERAIDGDDAGAK